MESKRYPSARNSSRLIGGGVVFDLKQSSQTTNVRRKAGRTLVIYFNNWLTVTGTKMALWYSLLTGVILLHISSSKKCSVDICVKTQPWPSAGTDENVYVKLFCNNGRETPWISIDDPKADDFESDELKCYSIEGLREYMETDEIVKVGVKLMGSRNAKSAWDFDFIAVLYRCQCRSYRFYTSINVDDPPEYRNYKGNCTIKQRIFL